MSMRTPSNEDLKRLGAAAEAFSVACRMAEYDEPSPRDPGLTIGLKRLARKRGEMMRARIEAGYLLEQAEELVHPGWGCCCGVRFLSMAESVLHPGDVLRLRALADSQEARDEFQRELAEGKTLLRTRHELAGACTAAMKYFAR